MSETYAKDKFVDKSGRIRMLTSSQKRDMERVKKSMSVGEAGRFIAAVRTGHSASDAFKHAKLKIDVFEDRDGLPPTD